MRQEKKQSSQKTHNKINIKKITKIRDNRITKLGVHGRDTVVKLKI